jgi:hypothetical protein
MIGTTFVFPGIFGNDTLTENDVLTLTTLADSIVIGILKAFSLRLVCV